MSEITPVIYLLDGEDEFGIAEFLTAMQARLGDAATAEMNTTRLDGRSASLEDLDGALRAMPFLAPRRLVIFTNPLARLNTPTLRDKLKKILEKAPPSAAVVLVEDHLLTEEKERKKNKTHWLEKWASDAGERVYVRHFSLPVGEAMARWIMERARSAGGQFTYPAAAALANLVGDQPRQAVQEIDKLLAYVNYSRPVEVDDVESMTPLTAPVRDFALVNALRARNARLAQEILHRMLAEQDSIPLFHSIVYQFRQLLLAREILEAHGNAEEVARQLKIHPFAAKLALEQAHRFIMPDLEAIYHHLLKLDEAIKTSQMSGELALDLLIIQLTTQSAHY
ncbi:MAG: DNA polymerase III subunit delta [Anaerolineales bacterium]|nr:DNA polymerase III subunit delta [Anaerolineales bacterium]